MKRYYRRGGSTSANAFMLVIFALMFVCGIAISAISALISFISSNIGVFIWCGVILLAIFAVCLALYFIDKYYRNFIYDHSISIQRLSMLNEEFHFHTVPSFDCTGSYDNKHYYDLISPKDYLTYQLVFSQKEIISAIERTKENRHNYDAYISSIASIKNFDTYDIERVPKWAYKRIKIEKTMFDQMMLHPKTEFTINVKVKNTNINGVYLTSKSGTFSTPEIEDTICRINNRIGGYYQDSEIWEAICRVERGKVTNKLRFAIYDRDGHRCRRCGSTHDLEVDHIFPISKGGKTTFDNLQTLCHRCNAQKSNTVEYGVRNPSSRYAKDAPICPNCNVELVVRNGRNGKFYGCPNYPNCRFTKKL